MVVRCGVCYFVMLGTCISIAGKLYTENRNEIFYGTLMLIYNATNLQPYELQGEFYTRFF